MSIHLKDIVKIIENTPEHVLLEIQPNNRLNLMKLGFDGDEEYIRLRKGDQKICTIWKKDSYLTWDWGRRGHTLISESLKIKQGVIVECIVRSLDIYIDEDRTLREQTCHTDMKHAPQSHKLSVCEIAPENLQVHKDGAFFGVFDSYDTLKKVLTSYGWKLSKLEDSALTTTGYLSKKYTINRINTKQSKGK